MGEEQRYEQMRMAAAANGGTQAPVAAMATGDTGRGASVGDFAHHHGVPNMSFVGYVTTAVSGGGGSASSAAGLAPA